MSKIKIIEEVNVNQNEPKILNPPVLQGNPRGAQRLGTDRARTLTCDRLLQNPSLRPQPEKCSEASGYCWPSVCSCCYYCCKYSSCSFHGNGDDDATGLTGTNTMPTDRFSWTDLRRSRRVRLTKAVATSAATTTAAGTGPPRFQPCYGDYDDCYSTLTLATATPTATNEEGPAELQRPRRILPLLLLLVRLPVTTSINHHHRRPPLPALRPNKSMALALLLLLYYSCKDCSSSCSPSSSPPPPPATPGRT